MSSEVLEAFDQECETLSRVLHGLAVEDYDLPTNCPPWDVHELVVHVALSIRVPRPFPIGEGPASAAADYYRRPERDTDAYRRDNVDRGRAAAGEVARGEAANLFRGCWERASSVFRGYRGDELMAVSGLVLTVEGYLATRLVSVAAHGVDVALSLGRDAWTTAGAGRCLRSVFEDLLRGAVPASWSDRDLLEFGTGRRSLGQGELSLLGSRSELFPLLS